MTYTATDTKIKPRITLENGCRQNHISVKSRHGPIFCKNCNDYVEKPESGKICVCCKQATLQTKNHLPMIRIINCGIKQHKNFLRSWMLFPSDVEISNDGKTFARTKNPVWLEIRHQETVYEVKAKYLALAYERPNHHEILGIFKKNVRLKGLRMLIPDDETTDSKCPQCNEYLKVGRRGNEFCPRCVKSTDVWDTDFFK